MFLRLIDYDFDFIDVTLRSFESGKDLMVRVKKTKEISDLRLPERSFQFHISQVQCEFVKEDS